MNRLYATVYMIRGIRWLLLAWCSIGLVEVTFGQDDIYKQQLRSMAAAGPAEFGRALRESIRLKDWKETEFFLTTGPLNNFDDAGRRAVAELVGSRFLARAVLEESLGVSAKTVIEELNRTLIDAKTDPAVLDAAIDALGSEDQDAQLNGGRTLLAGGTPGLSRLLLAAASPTPRAPLPRMIEILRGFGPDAVLAAEALSIDGPSDLTYGAMRVLFGLDSARAMPIYAANLFASGSGDSMKALSAAGLKRTLEVVPDRETASAMLCEHLREANRRALGFTQDESPSVRWRYDESTSSLQPEVTTARIVEAGKAAALAKMVSMIGTTDTSAEIEVIHAILRSAVAEDSLADAEALGTLLGEAFNGQAPSEDSISEVLSRSLGDGLASDRRIFDEAAAVGACRWLGRFGSSQCLVGRNGGKGPICTAVRGSTPRLRYEASAAIANLNPSEPYAGSDLVLQSWFEMGELGTNGRALLLVNSIDLGISLSQRLESMGFSVTRASKGSEVLSQIEQGGDIQAVVLTSYPPDFSAVELIDRVRRLPLGSTVPMIVVGPARPGLDQVPSRWRYPVGVIQWDEETNAAIEGVTNRMQESLVSMQAKLTLPPLSGVERKWFLDDAIGILGRLAEDPRLDEIYHWRNFESEVIAAVVRAGYGPESLRVLSGLGSTEAQGLLLSALLDLSIDVETRKQASSAIVESIQRFGVRLSRQQVVDLYDRYEMATEEDTREVIVAVLDAIEKRAGVTTTSR